MRFCANCGFDYSSLGPSAAGAVPQAPANSLSEPSLLPNTQRVSAVQPIVEPGPSKPWYRKRLPLAGAVVAILLILGTLGRGGGSVSPVANVPTPTPTAMSTLIATPNATLIAATTVPTQPVTAAPTIKPTPVVTLAPVTYTKLTSRTWALIVKNPDAYIGDTYQVWACITQFDAATGPDGFRGQGSYTNLDYWYLDGDNAIFTGDADQLAAFVQDDVVYMHVTVGGAYSYDTQIGGNTTAPSFEIDAISRKGSCA